MTTTIKKQKKSHGGGAASGEDEPIRIFGYSIRIPRLLRFLVVGGFGAFVNLAFVWIGSNVFSLSNTGASTLGILVSVFSNFIINSSWTFKDSASSRDTKPHSTVVRVLAFFISCGKYYIASSLAVAVQFFVAFVLLPYIPIIYITQFVGILFGTAVNYYVQSRWTFGNRGAKSRMIKPGPILPV
eukprot:TRINITY_DN8877_c0_g1_i1.p1 TRINITY_DN8877_c0_g1~~TRINITY_DN8877_c0_g1_i1.p1  ORF type:complete len:185 (-),score=33.80 TRINITY_DN8877_c0_g1_i1:213-767(-)